MKIEFEGKKAQIVEEMVDLFHKDVSFRCDECGGFLATKLTWSAAGAGTVRTATIEVKPCENCCK